MNEFMVDSEPGISIFVRNKHPAGMERFESAKTVVFVHGATYPSETSFDLALDGESWMDYIARKGYDVYLLDVRGYGRSTRPPQMDKPAQDSLPFAQTEEAVRDVGAVVDFVRKRRGIEKVNLLAWSWGTMIMPSYASRNSDKVVKLALYAPLWLRQTPGSVLTGGAAGPLPAYRTETQEEAKARWLAGVPDGKRASLIPPGWFETWASATWATDPVGAQQNPPVLSLIGVIRPPRIGVYRPLEPTPRGVSNDPV